MFVDSVKIFVKAGDGGDGGSYFLHEKYIDKGGPSGGNGGRGGSIIFVGEEGLTTLLDFRFTRKIKAESGQNGMDKNMFGKSGKNVYVKVPIGTTIIDADTQTVIGDITKHNQEVVVAEGGRGGKGNACFASSRNPAPEISEKGYLAELEGFHAGFVILAETCLKKGIDVPVFITYYKKATNQYIIDAPVNYSKIKEKYVTKEEITKALCIRCNELGKMEFPVENKKNKKKEKKDKQGK